MPEAIVISDDEITTATTTCNVTTVSTTLVDAELQEAYDLVAALESEVSSAENILKAARGRLNKANQAMREVMNKKKSLIVEIKANSKKPIHNPTQQARSKPRPLGSGLDRFKRIVDPSNDDDDDDDDEDDEDVAREGSATNIHPSAPMEALSHDEMMQKIKPLDGNWDCPPAPCKSFSRFTISEVVGGSQTRVFPKPCVGKEFPFAIGTYLCAVRETDCWLPESPGDKGCLFVTQSKIYQLKKCNLFIKECKNHWVYFGEYEAAGVYQVKHSDWINLPETTKRTWAENLIGHQWGRSLLLKGGLLSQHQLNAMTKAEWRVVYLLINEGHKSVDHLRPQVQLLRPLRYHRKLYDLLAQRQIHFPEKTRVGKRKRQPGEGSTPDT